MALTKAAILALRGLDKAARERIARAAGVHLSTLNRWIASNDDTLTKAAISQVISEEIGLEVSDILEKPVGVSEVKETQN